MKKRSTYTVKDVARIAKISVRALHHYDDIGLLVPDRSANGYRTYTDGDLLRLQQILISRSFGIALEDIKRSLDDPGFDMAASLRDQRAKLVARLTETHRAIASIDTALETLTSKEKAMSTDMSKIFDGFDPADHEAEAKERWGDTPAYKESRQRTQRYGEKEWAAIKAELSAIWSDGAAAMQAGHGPDGADGRAIAERHRQHIERWFYALTPDMHAGLADMWEADPRFAKNIDKHGEGLTQWVAAAVRHAAGN